MEKLTEKQLEEIALRIAEPFRASVMNQSVYYGMGAEDLLFVIKRLLAALPKPEAVEVMFENIETDEWKKKTLYTEAPIITPASTPIGWDAEFLAKRLGRVAKLAGVSIPERFTHEQVAETAGTTLGQIAAAIEERAIQLDTLLARLEVISEVHVISATYDRIRTERIFAADDLEYDLFATGMKTAIEMMKGGTK